MIIAMASRFGFITLILFLFLFNFVSCETILEEGYTVTTVIDGNKLNINPHSVLAAPRSSHLLLLDSSNSHLYSVSFPLSNESEVKRISSGADAGYRDGELGQARFSKPRSFAVDAQGNVFVADKDNHVIRKINTLGIVTTIAGGYSKAAGKKDGPAQNAAFSSDFEIATVVDRCILLVVDHGNRAVRQIDLKPDDCATASPSGQIFGLGALTIWTLGLGLSCLLGLFVGILVRPYIIPYGHSTLIRFNKIWKSCLILGKQVVILCFGIRSVVVNFKLYALVQKLFGVWLSHLSLMFRVNSVESCTSQKVSVSLLDSDDSSDYEVKKSQVFADQFKDLICFDGSLELPNIYGENLEQSAGNQKGYDVLPDCLGRLDTLIEANIMGFINVSEETIAQPVASSSGLVKRR